MPVALRILLAAPSHAIKNARDDLDCLVAGEIEDTCANFALAVDKTQKPVPIESPHMIIGGDSSGEQRIEEELRAPCPLLGTGRRPRLIALTGVWLAFEQIAREARAINHIETVGLWKSCRGNQVGDAPSATKLHAARRNHPSARQPDRTVAEIDDRAFDPTPAELNRRRQAHRARANYQNRGLDGLHLSKIGDRQTAVSPLTL